jgi:hypothetical protein
MESGDSSSLSAMAETKSSFCAGQRTERPAAAACRARLGA